MEGVLNDESDVDAENENKIRGLVSVPVCVAFGSDVVLVILDETDVADSDVAVAIVVVELNDTEEEVSA